MKRVGVCLIVSALTLGSGVSLNAQEVNEEPLRDAWAPSDWGPDDKAGAVNRTAAELVLKAAIRDLSRKTTKRTD